MGYLELEDYILEHLKLNRDNRSNNQADQGYYTTSMDGIDLADDMQQGQTLVI